MIRIFFLLYLLLIPFISIAQSITAANNDCERMINEGDEFANQKKFKEAIYKYAAARSCDAALVQEINQKIIVVFQKIELEKIEAIKQTKIAKEQREKADKQTKIAEKETKEAERQKQIAIEEKLKAEKQARIAENSSLGIAYTSIDPTLAARILEYSLSKDPNYRSASISLDRILSDKRNQYYRNSFNADISRIHSITLNSDGTRLAMGSYNNTAKVWDIKTGKILGEFKGHSGWVSAVALSADGTKLATGSYDKTVKLWDIGTGKIIREFIGHSSTITHISFSKDSKFLVTSSLDNTAKLWNISKDKWVQDFKGHKSGIYSVAFSNDGKKLATGSLDSTAIIWDITSGIPLKKCIGHTAYVRSVVFSIDGKKLVTGSGDRTAKLWDISSNKFKNPFKSEIEIVKPLQSFTGHKLEVNTVALSPDRTKVITGSSDRKVMLWDANTGTLLNEFVGHTKPVFAIYFDGNKLVTASEDKTAKEWNLNIDKILYKFEGFPNGIDALALSIDGKWLATGSENTTKLWNIQSRLPLKPYEGHMKQINSIMFSPDNKKFVTSSSDGKAKLWDIESKQAIRTITISGNNPVLCNGGKFLITLDRDAVKIWDVENGNFSRDFIDNTHDFIDNKGSIKSAALSADGKKLVTGSCTYHAGRPSTCTAKLWDMIKDTLIREFIPEFQESIYVALSSDGKNLVTGNPNVSENPKLWNVDTGELLQEFIPTTRTTFISFALSKNNEWLITGSLDSIIRIWDIKTGVVLREFSGHAGSVKAVAISEDSKTLVSSSADKTAIQWCLNLDCGGNSFAYLFSLKELRAEGVNLEPEDLLKLKQQGEKLTEKEELILIEAAKNKK